MEDLERQPEHTEAPESVLKAYMAGNARFPTFAFPFVVLMAKAAIFDEHFDPVSLARSRLSEGEEGQLERLKTKIAAQHALNDVRLAPAGHEKEVREGIARLKGCAPEDVHVQTIPDDNFQRQWHRHIHHTIGIIGALVGVRKPPPEKEIDKLLTPFVYEHVDARMTVDDKKLMSLAKEIAWRLQSDDTRMQAQNALRSFAQALDKDSPYAEKRSEGIRALKDRHESSPLNEELFKAMIAKYERDIMKYGYRRVLAREEIQDFKTMFFRV